MSRLVPLEEAGRAAGAKAARLARALRAGLPVLPGWVLPVAAGRPALRAGAAAVRRGGVAAGRRAVLSRPLDPGLTGELREAVARLGGRVIVRSSSPLERDPRWSGAFSSLTEVGPDDVAPAVRSCWSSAFAVDPLERLEACGLLLEALELGVLIQPEIRPAAGGIARLVSPPGASGAARPGRAGRAPGAAEVIVEGIEGHPAALLSGWAEGASTRVRLPGGAVAEGQLAALIGPRTVLAVARLAEGTYRALGDDVIEWAACDGKVWLLQSLRSVPAPEGVTAVASGEDAVPGGGAEGEAAWPWAAAGLAGLCAPREWMPVLAAAVLSRGEHVRARPAAPGTAAGRLLAGRPHERPSGDCRDAILLVDRPVPALAPLLFAARGVIARTGAPGSHLAEVARSLGVPMVVGCRPELAAGPLSLTEGAWLAAVDGSTGDVAFLPDTGAGIS
jgi:phosphohistidine swiveling domain-containing protein